MKESLCHVSSQLFCCASNRQQFEDEKNTLQPDVTVPGRFWWGWRAPKKVAPKKTVKGYPLVRTHKVNKAQEAPGWSTYPSLTYPQSTMKITWTPGEKGSTMDCFFSGMGSLLVSFEWGVFFPSDLRNRISPKRGYPDIYSIVATGVELDDLGSLRPGALWELWQEWCFARTSEGAWVIFGVLVRWKWEGEECAHFVFKGGRRWRCFWLESLYGRVSSFF